MTSYLPSGGLVCAVLMVIICPWRSLDARPDEQLVACDLLIRGGEYEKAEVRLQQLKAELPQNVELLLRLGIVESLLKKYASAHQTLNDALKIAPEDPRILHNIGLVYLRQGDRANAKAYFEKTLAIRPWHPETNFHLGLIYEAAGDKEKAIECFVKELNDNGRCAKAWQHLLILKGNDGSGPGISWRLVLIGSGLAVIGMAIYYWNKRLTDKEIPCVE